MTDTLAVGRSVHYRDSAGFGPVCRAAVVAEVEPHVDGLYDRAELAVFMPGRVEFKRVTRNPRLMWDTWHWYTECEEQDS